jgi:uncharacterized protein involved in exopolysaccharide biosynthesis
MHNSYVEPPIRPLVTEQLSFLALLNFVLRNLGLMIVLGVLVTTALAIRVVTSPETYSSTSIVSTGDEAGGTSIIALLGGGTRTSNPGAQFYIDLMGAPVLLEPLAQVEYDFPDGKHESAVKFYGGNAPADRALEAATAELSGKLHPHIAATSGWLVLRTTAESPRLAIQLNQSVLNQLDLFNAAKRKKQALEDRRFAEERLAELGVEVRSAENRLQSFLEKNRDLSPPGLAIERERLSDSVATRRALYSTVLQSYDRERLDEERQVKLLTIIGRPTVPHVPDKRAFGRTVILGLFAGAFLGALVGVAKEYFRRIRAEATPEYDEYRALLAKWFGWLRGLKRKATA